MKQIFFFSLLTVFIWTTSVQLIYSQDKTIVFPKESLQKRLERIIKQEGVTITYTAEMVKNIQVPLLKLQSAQPEKWLQESLKNTELSYSVIGRKMFALTKQTEKVETIPMQSNPINAGIASIHGRIVESETSEPIQGATIRIAGKQLGVLSDENGYYTLSKVPAGKINLEVSFVGFNTEKLAITLTRGEDYRQDVKLSAGISLSGVEVKGIRHTRGSVPHTTEKFLVAEVKGLSVVASGISSEQISKTADRNAAQAVAKVSGVSIVDDKFVVVRGLNPRYNLTYLNDNVAPATEANSRSFALDLIPSRIIDRILVQKTASPDVQADATGGVVKVYTKDAQTVKHFDIELQLGYRENTTFNNGFMTYNGGKTDWLGFDDGTRALPKGLPALGSLLKTQWTPEQYVKGFNPTLNYKTTIALPNMQLTANYYTAWNVFDKTLSSLTSFSYKNENQIKDIYHQEGNGYNSMAAVYQIWDKSGYNDQSSNTAQLNLLQNFTLKLNDHNTLFFKNFILQQGTSSVTQKDRWGTYYTTINQTQANPITSWVVDKDIILAYNQRFLYAGNLGGAHEFGHQRHELKWNLGYTYSRQDVPDQRISHVSNANDALDVISTGSFENGSYTGPFIAKGFVNGSPASYKSDYKGLSNGIITRLWSRNGEGVYNGSLDYTFKIVSWLTAKAGTFQQWKKRTYNRRVYTVNEADIVNVDNPSTINTGERNEDLVRFSLEDLNNVWSSKYITDDQTGLRVNDRTNGSDTYIATEQNNSGYVMLSLLPANRFVELSGGMRYEYDRQKIAASVAPDLEVSQGQRGQMNTAILIDKPTSSWFPSVNFALRPADWMVFRAAASKTVNRTEFREVSPFQEIDYVGGTKIYGNPDLVSAKINNYDLRLEFYPKGNNGDMISAGVFYKDLKNPIERMNTTARLGSQFARITFANAKSAVVKGLEVEVRKSFDFLPLPFFRSLSFVGNFSLISSEAQIDSVYLGSNRYLSYKRRLQGQAPYMVNAGLYYDNAGWGTKIALIYNRVGESIMLLPLVNWSTKTTLMRFQVLIFAEV